MSMRTEIESCIAWHCAGVEKAFLPKDRAELKLWHGVGKIDDINSFNQDEIEDIAIEIIKIVKARE